MAVFLRVGRGGRTESFDPAGWDVEDAVPYTLRHCEEYPKGTCFAARSDAAIRSPRHKETDSRAGDMGGQSRSTLRRFVSLLDKLTLAAYNLRGVPPLLR